MLVFQLIPGYVLAETINNDPQENKVVLFAEEINEEIELYEDSKGETILDVIQDDTIVEMTEKQSEENEEYSFIRYIFEVETDDQEIIDQVIEGYVHNDRIVLINKADQYRTERLETEEEVEVESEAINFENTQEQPDENSESTDLEDKEVPKESEEIVEDEVEEIDKVIATHALTAEQSEPLVGLALKQPVSVYIDTNRDSEVLKSYNYGHLLKFQPYSDDWYKATVFLNGKPHSGYIHTSDVGEAKNTSSVTGVALKQRTSVHSDTTKSSKVLKCYQQGYILKYKAYDKDWFIARVFINGKAHTSYIHINDVKSATTSRTTLHGAGLKESTPIYATASTGSRILKTYNYGHILKYQKFTSNWYAATVYINGKPQGGYIYKNDVAEKDTVLTGYGQANPTTVYSGTSKSSTKLKSYVIGSTLKYRPYKNGWFQATVMYKGQWTTGYIDTKDVGENQLTLYGYGHANPTTVYSKTSKSSTKLKSYQLGSSLKYRPYNNDWYEATVKHNGKWTTGYIHKSDVAFTKPTLNVADKLNTVGNNNQLILVTSKGYNTSKAKIETYERNAKGRWIRKLSVSGHIGKNGFATNKVEGDGKSPVGKYSLGTAFGQKDNPGTKLPFKSITNDDVWVDDPNSRLYNTWQSRSKTSSRWKSAENMNHRLYTYGFVINYNTNSVVRNKGSAIFFHVGNSYTVGCTATSETDVISIMQWLDPNKNPVIIQTPEAGLDKY